MKTTTILSKMLCVLAILAACSLSAHAEEVRDIDPNADFMSLLLDNYESDYVMVEECNYYRNFLSLLNMEEGNALTVDLVNEGENAFTLYRYDIYNPDVLLQIATLVLYSAPDGVHYSIEYQDDTQAYRPYDNVNVVTQGILAVNNGVIELDSIKFVDRFAADVSTNTHPSGYGYVLKSFLDNQKSTNYVVVPVMKLDANIGGFYTQQEVDEDVDALLVNGVKNANVEMYLQSNPSIYYYELERGNNTAPNEIISRLQRRTDGTYVELSGVLNEEGYIFDAPGYINRYDNTLVTGVCGEYMTYVPVVWTFAPDRTDWTNNSYGSPIFRTGVAEINMAAEGAINANVHWLDEDGQKCILFNPIVYISAYLPDYANVEYEPYMYRVWCLCHNIRNYKKDENGRIVNDVDAPRDVLRLLAEEQSDSLFIKLGSEDGEELAFGGTLDSEIILMARFYYKRAGEDTESTYPMYYVVEEAIPWDNYIFDYPLFGDVDGDRTLSIGDVTVLIDYLLSGYTNNPLADVNWDGEINIADLTALIDLLLAGN